MHKPLTSQRVVTEVRKTNKQKKGCNFCQRISIELKTCYTLKLAPGHMTSKQVYKARGRSKEHAYKQAVFTH